VETNFHELMLEYARGAVEQGANNPYIISLQSLCNIGAATIQEGLKLKISEAFQELEQRAEESIDEGVDKMKVLAELYEAVFHLAFGAFCMATDMSEE
jgi:hypothetical protein